MNTLTKTWRLDPGPLAVVMFVALALLSTTRGNDFRAATSAARTEGYLQVYSATDEFDDGGLLYYAHSSYAIYSGDGKVFKTVENHISRSDEIPEMVKLPVGSYTVEARSTDRGYMRVRVVIKPGRLTILDLDARENWATERLALKQIGTFETRSAPALLGATLRTFAFYVAVPTRSILRDVRFCSSIARGAADPPSRRATSSVTGIFPERNFRRVAI